MALGARELLLVLRARDEATRTVNALGRSMRNLDKDAKAAITAQANRGQALSSAGVGIAGIGVAMAGALAQMTNAAVEYERQSALTFTQLDNVKGSVKEIEDIGKRVARAVPAPFEQMQASLFDIFSSMDVNMQEAEVLLTAFSKAAVAGQVDLQEAARGTIGILNAYGMKAGDVHKINDVMFQLVRKGVGTYGEFARTIGRAVPSAVRAGQSIEDLAGMMAFLTRNGLSTAMAAASAGRALDAISNPKTIEKFADLGVKVADANGKFRPMAQIMKDLGIALKDLPPAEKVEVLQELFKGSGGTIQARRFIDIAIKQYPQLIDLTESMGKATGEMDEAYGVMSKTGASSIQDLKNNWEILQVEIGSALIPVLKDLTVYLKQAFDWWSSLSDGQKKAVGITAAVAAGLAILAGIVLVVAGGIALLAAAAAAIGIAMGPFILIIVGVIAGIIGLVAAVKSFWEAGGPVVDLVKTLFQWMGTQLKGAWDDLVAAIQPILPILKFVGMIIGGVVIVALLALVGAIRVLAAALKIVIDVLSWLVEAIIGGAVTAWNTLYGIVEGFVNGVVGFFQWLYDVLIGNSIIPDLLNGIIQWWKNGVKWLTDIWNKIRKTAIAIWEGIKKWFISHVKSILNALVSWAADMMTRWNKFWSTVRGLWDLGIKFVKTVWNNFLTGLRTVWEKLTKPITDRINTFVEGVKKAFTNAKENVIRIWQSLQGPLKVPVNFMIGIYNNGIKRLADNLAGFVGIKARLPSIGKFAAGGVLPGYTPGRDPYAMPMAAFSGGEAIMRPEFTRAVGSGFVDRANLVARQSGVDGVRKWMAQGNQMGGEGMAFKNGGIIQRFANGGIFEKIGNFISGIKDFTITNVKKAAGALLDKIFAGAIPGGGMIKDLITRVPVWMKDVLLKWIDNKVTSMGGGGTWSGKGSPAAMAFARAQNGKPYIWGGAGPRGYDCSGFMGSIQNVIRGRNPYSRLYSTHSFGASGGPDGMQRNLRSGFMVGVTNAGVGHMAGTLMGVNVESRGSRGVIVGGGARGFNNGLFPYRYGLKFDNGGYLQPGLNMARNHTGQRERVLDPDETKAYERGGRGQQNFYIYTHEINPRYHAALLGAEYERRSAP